MLVLFEIYCCLQQWKNFANRSRIHKVIAMWHPFFNSRCICPHPAMQGGHKQLPVKAKFHYTT